MTVIQERLATLDALHLQSGSHYSYEDGICAMEFVAFLAGEDITDAPQCASSVLRAFTISLNDNWPDGQRQKLKPFLPRMVGTAGDGLDEARSYLALDWLIRSFTPAWLDLAGLNAEAKALRELRRVVDLAAAKAAGPIAGAAAQAAAQGAAGAAAQAAAWDAAWAAAQAAAQAAAWDAARDAAQAALQPTVETLQASVLDLLDQMISPAVAR